MTLRCLTQRGVDHYAYIFMEAKVNQGLASIQDQKIKHLWHFLFNEHKDGRFGLYFLKIFLYN